MARKIRKWIFFIVVLAILFFVGLNFPGGQLAKSIEEPDGITIEVPRNFPKPILKQEGKLKILSFNIQPHEKSRRFINFFEVISSSSKVDFLNRILQEGYKSGKSDEENILINGHNANLKTIDLEITHPCGSKEKAKLYVVEYGCDSKDKYIYILTFTMTKKGFLEVVKTLRCH